MPIETAIEKKQGFIGAFVARFTEFRITGLDISDLSMKYVSFDKTKKNKIILSAFGEITYPEGIIANGQIKDEQKLTDELAKWRVKEKKNIPSPFVALSLPEEKSFIRAVKIPRVRREDIANAIRWEIENQIPLPLEEVTYDYEIITNAHTNQDQLDIIITAFPRDILLAYVRAVKAAGLIPYAIELESQSLTRACVQSSQDNVVIVDVGRTRTSLVLFAGGAILYTSTIEYGGLIFEQYIAKQLGIRMEEARQLKIDIGLDKTRQNGEVYMALIPAITAIGDEVSRALAYYQGHSLSIQVAAPAIQTVLLSGGDANLRGLDTYLASVLKINVERADPFSIIKNKSAHTIPPLTRHDALAYATAIGLALREIR